MSAPGFAAYNDKFGPEYYAYDLSKAKKLLRNQEFRLLIEAASSSNRSFDVHLGETIQSMLKEAGIEVTLQVIDPLRFNDFQKMAADAAIGRKAGRARTIT